MVEAPLYVDVLLCAIYLLLALSVGLVVWSLVRSVRQGTPGAAVSNNLPVRRIGLCVAALLAASLLLTFLLGSQAPLTVNGHAYADTFWLRVSDMFIGTTAVLLAVAVGIVVFGKLRNCKGGE